MRQAIGIFLCLLWLSFSAHAEEVPTLVRVQVPEPGAANVREQPSASAKKLAALRNGDFVANFGCETRDADAAGPASRWCRVRVSIREGWVLAKYLAPQSGGDLYEIIGISDDDGVEAKSVPGRVGVTEFLLPLGQAGINRRECKETAGETWCRIDTRQIIGWINAKYLVLDEVEVPPAERQIDLNNLYGDWSLTKGCKGSFTRYTAKPEWVSYTSDPNGSYNESSRGDIRIDEGRNSVCLASGFEFVSCGTPEVLSRRIFKALWTGVPEEDDSEPVDKEISTSYRCARIPADDIASARNDEFSEVPTVGCPYQSMAEDLVAPRALPSVRLKLDRQLASRLAVYRAEQGPAALAPRGWSCLSSMGTSGSYLVVMPSENDIKAYRNDHGSDALSGNRWLQIVKVSEISGSASGRYTMAQQAAILFPKSRPNGNTWTDFNNTVRTERYAHDHVVELSGSEAVEFETPAEAVGAGSVIAGVSPNGDPIVGAAYLKLGKYEESLTSVAIRLAPGIIDLAPAMIRRFEEERGQGAQIPAEADGADEPTGQHLTAPARNNWLASAHKLFVRAWSFLRDPDVVGLFVLSMVPITLWLVVRAGWLSMRLVFVVVGLGFLLLVLLNLPKAPREESGALTGTAEQVQAELDKLSLPGLANAVVYTKCQHAGVVAELALTIRDPAIDPAKIVALDGSLSKVSGWLHKEMLRRRLAAGRIRLIELRGENFFEQKLDEVESQTRSAYVDVAMKRCLATGREYFGDKGALHFGAEQLWLSVRAPLMSTSSVVDACSEAESSVGFNNPLIGQIRAAREVCTRAHASIQESSRIGGYRPSIGQSYWAACTMVADACFAD